MTMLVLNNNNNNNNNNNINNINNINNNQTNKLIQNDWLHFVNNKLYNNHPELYNKLFNEYQMQTYEAEMEFYLSGINNQDTSRNTQSNTSDISYLYIYILNS